MIRYRKINIKSAYGSSQNVHPDVIYIPQGFVGYKYWMVFTPFPFGKDRYENPSVRASNDGYEWTRIKGTPDPVVLPPRDAHIHHADPEIVYQDGRLYLFFVTINTRLEKTTFSVMSSYDAVAWERPEIIYENSWGVSPTLIVDNNQWLMWYVYCDIRKSGFRKSCIKRRDGLTPSLVNNEVSCSLEIPGHVVWHMDIIKTERQYEALITAFKVSRDPSRSVLFHAYSNDGINFCLSHNKPILKPSVFGWDNRMIYRSTFLKMEGCYKVWYSAASWRPRFGIAYFEAKSLTPNNTLFVHWKSPLLLIEDILGIIKYLFLKHLPNKHIETIRRILRFMFGTKVFSSLKKP